MSERTLGAVYSSNDWEIDLTRRELRSQGISVPLGSRAFEILEILVRSGGELVGKNRLMERVWPGAVVEENTLQFHISAIRKALAADRGLLKTVSGRGYRLLGRWTVYEAADLGYWVGKAKRKPTRLFQTNVPIAGSVLIGRSAPRQHLLDVLSAYRVVTLTGPGGIGKSVLALEVARNIFPTLEGDCKIVELASLSDPALVPAAVASVVGLTISGNEISAEAVARAIDAEKLLLILDNCEHLVDAAARLAEVIVRICPHVLIVVTSREILRIEGECVYRVPPLDVPPELSDQAVDVDSYSAVQLFNARLSALDSGFSAQSESLPLVAAICRQLDGIPLAIEFAAARVATLGLQQIADRLNDRFNLLTAGRRTALPRHRTLRATLDWSYELLAEQDRSLLRRLAIFAGGFTLESVQAVMSDGGATVAAVAEGIGSLVSKSLVSSGTFGRWGLLETVRAYAFEKLAENGEVEPIASRHAQFVRSTFVPAMAGPIVPAAELPRYEREIDNLRAALEWSWSRDGDKIDVGVGLAAAAAPVFLAMSLLSECLRWSERALDALDDDLRGTAEEMHLQASLGYSLMYTRGGGDVARTALERGLSVAGALGHLLYQMWLLNALWLFHTRKGDFKNALQYARRGSALATTIADASAIALAHFFLGNSFYLLGDLAGARAELEAALLHGSRARRVGTTYLGFDYYILADISLANTLCLQGYPDQAVERARKILNDAESIDHPVTLSILLRHAILVFLWIGDLRTAEKLIDWHMSNAWSHSLGPQFMAGRALKAEIAIRRGDVESGIEMLQDAVKKLRAAQYASMASTFNISLAQGFAATGRFAEGLKLLDDGIGLIETNGDLVYMSELLRVKGRLLLSVPEPSADKAEAEFVRSLGMSRQQGARACELRTAIDLAKLMAAQGRREDARALLEPLFSWFTEGLDTTDLRFANDLLTTLR